MWHLVLNCWTSEFYAQSTVDPDCDLEGLGSETSLLVLGLLDKYWPCVSLILMSVVHHSLVDRMHQPNVITRFRFHVSSKMRFYEFFFLTRKIIEPLQNKNSIKFLVNLQIIYIYTKLELQFYLDKIYQYYGETRLIVFNFVKCTTSNTSLKLRL